MDNHSKNDPSNATNKIFLSNDEFSEGNSALKIIAYKSDAQLSKMDIEKNGLKIKAGKKVIISADFFIKGTASIKDLLLIDLESCSCWDPNVSVSNKCPGVRLILSETNGFLSIERGKISASTIQQSAYAFPRNQWVSVVWEMTLSDTEDGKNKLTVDGIEVINENAMNMPNAQIFKELFADNGINFELQEPVYYERVQIGATVNPTDNDVELFVDDFSIEVD